MGEGWEDWEAWEAWEECLGIDGDARGGKEKLTARDAVNTFDS